MRKETAVVTTAKLEKVEILINCGEFALVPCACRPGFIAFKSRPTDEVFAGTISTSAVKILRVVDKNALVAVAVKLGKRRTLDGCVREPAWVLRRMSVVSSR